jgi:threonine dehydratase
MAELLNLVAGARANLVSLEHVREAVPLHVRETGVELTLETRGPGHTEEVLAALRRAGYSLRLE